MKEPHILNTHLWRYLENELVARMQTAERAYRNPGSAELNQDNHNGAAIPNVAERGTLEQYQRAVVSLAEFLLHRRTTCVQDLLNPVLKMAIEVTDADMGNIQIFDRGEDILKIKAQRGFERPFLDFFASVHDGRGASCGAALKSAQRVVVDDVRKSPIFAGTDALEVLLDAGVYACQSTPMIGADGEVVGVLNTHYRKPTRPSNYDLELIGQLADHAAAFVAPSFPLLPPKEGYAGRSSVPDADPGPKDGTEREATSASAGDPGCGPGAAANSDGC